MTGGMMFKGTPGPWSVEDDAFEKDWPGFLNGHIGVNAPSHALIAQVAWRMSDGDRDRKDYPELQANAKLIASAPELLEALMKIVEDLEIRAKNGVVDCSNGVYYEAHNAIAKALGEKK